MTFVAWPTTAHESAGTLVVARRPFAAPHPSGLGFFDAIGSVVGGLIGSSTEKKRISAEQKIQQANIQAQLDASRDYNSAQRDINAQITRANMEIARIQSTSADRGYQSNERVAELSLQAAQAQARLNYLAEREVARSNVSVARSRYTAEVESTRQQRLAAEESGATTLAITTGQGILQSATAAGAEAGETLRSYPKGGNLALFGIVAVVGLAVMLPKTTGKKKPKGKKGRGRSKGASRSGRTVEAA